MRDGVCEYACTPKSNKVRSCFFVSGCIAAAFGMLAVSHFSSILSPYFKAFATVWLIVAALAAKRYLTTGYSYLIFRRNGGNDADLVIYELRFGEAKTVCRVSLFDVKELAVYDPVAELIEARRKGIKRPKRPRRPRPRRESGASRAYDYCVDILPAKYCLILVSEGAYVKFSPDGEMLALMKRYMQIP